MDLRKAIIAGILCATTLSCSGLAYSSNEELVSKGRQVAELQNSYGYYLTDAEQYRTVFRLLSRNFRKEDEDSCRIWSGSGEWKFCTRYVSNTDIERVIWLCYDGDKIVAYCVAKYDRRTGVFQEVSQHRIG